MNHRHWVSMKYLKIMSCLSAYKKERFYAAAVREWEPTTDIFMVPSMDELFNEMRELNQFHRSNRFGIHTV